jgi:hypothetical protein
MRSQKGGRQENKFEPCRGDTKGEYLRYQSKEEGTYIIGGKIETAYKPQEVPIARPILCSIAVGQG